MVRVLVHQRPDPEGRPDRRLSGAVECMVAIKNFGATGRGAGKFLHGRLRFGPGIEEKRRDVRPARRSRGCEVAVERLPEGIADRGDIAPDGRTPQPPRKSRVAFAVRAPAGMSFEPDGLEHPDQIVEMARVGGMARRLTRANSSAISRVRRRIQGDCGGRHGDAIGPAQVLGAHRRKQGHQDEQRSVTSNPRPGAQEYPKTRGRGRR
jgi:hypothetical protein